MAFTAKVREYDVSLAQPALDERGRQNAPLRLTWPGVTISLTQRIVDAPRMNHELCYSRREAVERSAELLGKPHSSLE